MSPRWLSLCVGLACVLGSGCGWFEEPVGQRREVDREPMVIPRTYERRDDYAGEDHPAVDLFEEDVDAERIDELVLEPNVYLLPTEAAESATLSDGVVRFPLDEYPYLVERQAGDVVISPDSSLSGRRIEAASTRDGTVVWETVRADLAEVVHDGYLYYEVDLTEAPSIPEIDLAEPYLTGPLKAFRSERESPTVRQGLGGEKTDCRKPPRCTRYTRECGTGKKYCPCSNPACDGTHEACGGNKSNVQCSRDPCEVPGAGRPRREMVGKCRKPGWGPFGKSRCTKKCDDDSDCRTSDGNWVCAPNGWCTPSCKSRARGESGEPEVPDGYERSWLAYYLDREIAKCLEQFNGPNASLIPHSYADLQAELRVAVDIRALAPAKTRLRVALEADALAGLGLLYDFEGANTRRFDIEKYIHLADLTKLGIPLHIKSKIDGKLELFTARDQTAKLDFKVYSTRPDESETCGESSRASCGKASWTEYLGEKKGTEAWDRYDETHSGRFSGAAEKLGIGDLPAVDKVTDVADLQTGDYGGVPTTESPDDPIIGTYAQDVESNSDGLNQNHGIVVGMTKGPGTGCWDYAWCDGQKSGDVTRFGKWNVHAMFGSDLETRVEALAQLDLAASVGVYTPSNKGRDDPEDDGDSSGDSDGGGDSGGGTSGGSGGDGGECFLDRSSGSATGGAFGGGDGDSEDGGSGDDGGSDDSGSDDSGSGESGSDGGGSGDSGSGDGSGGGSGDSEEGSSDLQGRLFFLEPVNFSSTLFATFDPPYCAWGFDLVYQPYLGVGPIEIAFIDLGELAFSVLKEPLSLDVERTVRPECYAREGGEPRNPSDMSGDDWAETKNGRGWKDESRACEWARSLARAHPDLACGAPVERGTEEARAVERCPCAGGKSCFSGICVHEPDRPGLRISLSNPVGDVPLNLEVVGPDGREVERRDRSDHDDGNYEVFSPVDAPQVVKSVTLPESALESGDVYRVRVDARDSAFRRADVSNVSFALELAGDGYTEELEGIVRQGDGRGAMSFAYRHP